MTELIECFERCCFLCWKKQTLQGLLSMITTLTGAAVFPQKMCPIQSGINTRTFHSIQFWIDIRIDLWMCNIVNANSLSWMGIHRVGENNLIQFTFTNWLPSFQIKSWMGMRVCANGIRIGHNSESMSMSLFFSMSRYCDLSMIIDFS